LSQLLPYVQSAANLQQIPFLVARSNCPASAPLDAANEIPALLGTPRDAIDRLVRNSIIKWEYGYRMMIAVATPNVTGDAWAAEQAQGDRPNQGSSFPDCAATPARMKR
jgi:hypothetical protein